MFQAGHAQIYNMFECLEVPLPDDCKNCWTNDFVYIAPEALPSKSELDLRVKGKRCRAAFLLEDTPDRRYTPACDVYALGMIMIRILLCKFIYPGFIDRNTFLH